jgi:hypothetical protein
MRVRRQNGGVVLGLNLFESRILLRALRLLIESYQLKPEDLDSKTGSAWYSTRGCVSASMNADETRDWIHHLHVLRGARLKQLERWAALLAPTKLDQYELPIGPGEEHVFLTAVNDYRLMLAARHDIGEAEMERHRLEELENLPPAQRTALFEIHFLAVVLEELLWELDAGKS